ncbi:leucine-rich repeat domain-containing protein [Anabaena azotica]|uniref:Leucine-rich repeat domain-containing protein n=1 Tax=Anabaena azotica FACHB-119 TaxID=947527 RepID=A0ABR8CZK8_9NOST|nr:leucine-rich repeat domain-containing protein [Anabaena azotica]MBD2500355.1 leucine-rich repeat domain-containing protein [Anabaena azotica FACHB-119]
MAQTLTWLHLSDLHACKPKTGWDARRVTDTLCKDLKKMQEKYGLRPDLIFFTGDAAYGHIGNSDGKSITEQFREAHDFLTAVRESFEPAIEQRNLFIVPGNHDVNRERITDFETEWLLSEKRNLDDITGCIQKMGDNWKQLLRRLGDYAYFLETSGYEHLLTGRDRLIYADAREFNGLRVGIAGFNSAWSSRGVGREEMGRLWMAGRFQLETLNQQMPPNDFKIALLHHPSNWLFPEENPTFGRQLERDFPFVLHGHEHQDFVRPNAANGHTVISTGACHEWSESKNNGYNFVRLDFTQGTGEVWLRQYDSTGAGWIPRVIYEQTDDLGCWNLTHLKPWMEKLCSSIAAKKNPNPAVELSIDNITSESKDDPAADYEVRYRQAVVNKLDYVQLFGIEVPKESKEYSLTVAYVSLNLSDEDEEMTEAEELEDDINELTAQDANTFPAEEVFDNLCDEKRLLIRGVAGSGKTTLLRWAAVQSAKDEPVSRDRAKQKLPLIKPSLSQLDGEAETQFADNSGDWREKIPFIIRLRDYTKGQLPRPSEFPLLLAKELPDPPTNWIDDVLNNGRALVMFDGVDEVPQQVRDETMREIRQLIKTYPDNYYVVTTRPEAVERREFIELGFVSARVEPMTPVDRDTFIDKWHEAMEVRLRNWNEPADLRPLAKRLKQRLETTPAVARLTSNPLLCAVVCALHRARNENLPETPVDLCEKLCEMLLDRRDKERSHFEDQKWINQAYQGLDFPFRKGLLSQLAFHMVSSGVSAITVSEAQQQISEALETYKKSNIKAADILQALVERSGMLQNLGEKIEFLHNTLKEFLAAERFVNIGDFQTLANHTDEASWQPVILFAVALPRDGSSFATDLVRAILNKTPLNAPAKRSKKGRVEAAKIRTQQFFFLRCYTNAYQLNDSEITQAFTQLSKQLLPPQNITDAVALASCGEAIIPYLKNRTGWKAAERAACVRMLGLIGDQRANELLKEFLDDKTLKVAQELVNFVDDWSRISIIRKHVEQDGLLPISIPKKLCNSNPLSKLNNLTQLNLSNTQVSDISVLSDLTNLTQLNLSNTQVSDISVLSDLTNLTQLDISYTQVSNISVLSDLTNLAQLDIPFTQVSDISVLSDLTNLTQLDISFTRVSDISVLADLTNLTVLSLSLKQVRDISVLADLTNLTVLSLSFTPVSDISVLAHLTNLKVLSLFLTPVSDISVLAHLTNLKELYLSGTAVSDVSVLTHLTNLKELDVSRTQVRDVSILTKLTNLTSLYLSKTQVSDVSVLANLTNLTSLNLSGTAVSDISALTNLTNLTSLNLSGTAVSDISALAHLTNNLTSLNISYTQVRDISALAHLTNLTWLNLSETRVSDVSSLAHLTNLQIYG